MSNSLKPDQDRHSVGPDLSPNCLQRLSEDDKSCSWQGNSYIYSVQKLSQSDVWWEYLSLQSHEKGTEGNLQQELFINSFAYLYHASELDQYSWKQVTKTSMLSPDTALFSRVLFLYLPIFSHQIGGNQNRSKQSTKTQIKNL